MSKVVLDVKNLSKSFTSPGGTNQILDGLNLTVKEREFICILGPSGCGKSTLLRCVAGFEDYEGTIECNGEVVKKPSTDRIMVFQDY
ncbi:MAG: ATP-binding cassette domain-containing protein, partial [Eubacterium sp.]|nr:ATP-binding cassette domain-containing protein [Eubacterium sp.]